MLVACIAVFAAEMFVNDCPRHGSALGGGAGCVASGFLRRFAFQPLRENPLLGPSSATYVPSLAQLASGYAEFCWVRTTRNLRLLPLSRSFSADSLGSLCNGEYLDLLQIAPCFASRFLPKAQ